MPTKSTESKGFFSADSSAEDAALEYAARGWPVFPCSSRKKPITENGFLAASRDAGKIREWWKSYPYALIGVPTGAPIGCVVLDIDVKKGVNGFRTLDEIDSPVRPTTPTVLTRSGGAHLYFVRPDGGLRNTNSDRGRGIGPGLDWRGDGGYAIVPTPGTGYKWDRWNFDTCDPLPVPPHLMPRAPEVLTSAKPVRPATGLSPYAARALDSACRRIIGAGLNCQESTLNGECFSIGTLAGAGAIPPDLAVHALLWAAHQMPSRDPNWPWTTEQIDRKVARAFGDGARRPRSASNG